METKNINCPQCGHAFDVQSILYDSIKSEFDSKYANKLLEVRQQYEQRYEEIHKKEEMVQDIISKGVQDKFNAERKSWEKKLRTQIETEKSDELESYKQQLQEKIKDTKELNRLKAEFEKLTREKSELKESLEASMERKLTDSLKTEREKFVKEYDVKNTFKIAEKEHVIQQLKEQLELAQRKAQQGSMQIQGEVQELAIEEFLINNFPHDKVEEVKKGARGGDCLQTVVSPLMQQCGTIYYESKRTKDFQMSWIDKFKKDLRDKNAIYGVLVTDCYPKGIERMTNIKGIWICSYSEFMGISFILRESILAVHSVVLSQENKGSKMETLYEYLTGSEFRGHLESIVEGFSQMQDDLNKERRAMEAIWKQREKQISKVIVNTTQLYGSIRGIAGTAIGNIKRLELPDGEN